MHVPADPEAHRDRAQASHDPADAERVGDRLPHAVAPRDLEIDHGGREPADLDLVDRVRGPRERGATVGERGDAVAGAGAAHDRCGRAIRVGEALGVDVVEGDLELAVDLGVGAEVGDDVPGELDAAGSDDDDPPHGGGVASAVGRVRGRLA